jgi:hypothetical protein
MITFKEFIFEMAAPSASISAKTYYHGTSSEKAGLGILANGIQPGDVIIQRAATKGPNLIPVPGKVYITPHLGTAQAYAIGGDLAGSNYKAKDLDFGYLFEIDGAELLDIQPDEDSVGELIYKTIHQPKDAQVLPFLRTWAAQAQSSLTPRQFEKFKDGEYVMYAHLGKKLLKNMSDGEKLRFIELGAHVAHTGALKYKSAWKIDLSKISQLKGDGSNFFDIAEKIK